MSESSNRFSTDQQIFIYWLALPKAKRQPRTMTGLAKELEVNRITLTRWKKIPELWEEVEKVRLNGLQEHTSDVYATIVERAKAGDHHHTKMFLDLVRGEFNTKHVKVSDDDRKTANQKKSQEELVGDMFDILKRGTGDKLPSKDDFVHGMLNGMNVQGGPAGEA